jgi:hypothetical protein
VSGVGARYMVARGNIRGQPLFESESAWLPAAAIRNGAVLAVLPGLKPNWQFEKREARSACTKSQQIFSALVLAFTDRQSFPAHDRRISELM